MHKNIFSKNFHFKTVLFHGVMIGLMTGTLIAFTDFLLSDILIKFIQKTPINYWFILPFIGFLLVFIFNHIGNVKNVSMADEIVQIYHHDDKHVHFRYLIFKFLSFLSTIAFGLTAGLEGASKWIGGIFGLIYFKFFSNLNIGSLKIKKNISLMSGASAGISAIFKAPLSGTIMALESPYKNGFDHDSLIQSFIASVISYSTFIFFRGDFKFFNINLNYNLKIQDIGISVLLGILCGIISLNLNITISKLKSKLTHLGNFKNILGGVLLSILTATFFYFFKNNDTLFSGMNIINSILDSQALPKYIIILLVFRILALIITFSFGAIGGQFLPSAAIGAAIGFLLQYYFQLNEPQVFVLVGIASFISASYNGLLFGPVLIAEMTGQPGLVVLGILASTISYLVTNGISNSQFQKDEKI